jgi:hypothetical protein
MSAVDDILYAPIDSNPPVLDQALIASIALALGDPTRNVTFSVDSAISLATYQRIAEIIETDRVVFRAARLVVASNPHGNFRPITALTIKNLFEFLHRCPGANHFFWTAKRSPAGVEQIEFANTFSIISGIPVVRMSDGRDYEWWIVGLMSQFAGYQGFYAFSDHNDAQNFWSSP